MTVDQAIELARSYSVEVRLNAAGDGLELEVETDPPQALINILSRAKQDIVATLRQREIDRRRPLITRWIKDHFKPTPPGVCRHCGEGALEGDAFVRLYCGDDSSDVHASCQPVWQKSEEAGARAALGLGPLPELSDQHQSFLAAVQFSPPPDVSAEHWQSAMRGLEAFLLAGHGDEALRLGWTHDELYAVPPLWARVDLCGVALLIGDREVVGVTADAIAIRAPSGGVLRIYRNPQIDYALIYETRLKLIRGNYAGDSEEPHLRAFEFTVSACRAKTGLGLEPAKRMVRDAIAAARTKETKSP